MATLSMEEYNKIKALLDDAEKSDTPYPSIKEDAIEVVGDANKTERNLHDFKITFIVPDENGEKKKTEQEFSNIYITPRKSTAIIPTMVELLPIFYKVGEDGSVGDYEAREATDILTAMKPSLWDAMYDTVAAILDIKNPDYMTPGSVLTAFTQFLKGYPETVNEAFDFFSS